MDGDNKYTNIPPKDVQSAIWGSCFDYADFDSVINGTTVRDRIYDCWQLLQLTGYCKNTSLVSSDP